MKENKLQFILCFVPYISFVAISMITAYRLKQKKVSIKYWCFFTLIIFFFGLAVSFVINFFSASSYQLLSKLLSYFLLTVGSLCCLLLQAVAKTNQQKPPFSKYSWLIVGFLAVFALGCVGMIILSDNTNTVISYEDANGPTDYSLCALTTDDILSQENHYRAKYVTFSTEGTQTEVKSNLKEYDYEQVSLSSKEANGIMTLQATNYTGNSLILKISSTVNTGNMAIFVIVDGEYFACIEANQDTSVAIDNASGKMIIVRMAAESAAVNVKVERELIA